MGNDEGGPAHSHAYIQYVLILKLAQLCATDFRNARPHVIGPFGNEKLAEFLMERRRK